MNENFESMCRMLGWGDPYGGLWFIGMEEAGVWGSVVEVADFWKRESLREIEIYGDIAYFESVDPDNRYEHVSGARRRTQIMNMQSRIAIPLSAAGPKSVEEYRERKLWCDDSGIFQSNIFPLGKPKVHEPLPAIYKDWFGYGPSDYADYVQDTRLLRFNLVRKLRAACQPQAIVCFGKKFWNYAAEIFELGEIHEYPDNLGFFDQQRVVLTPFLGQGISCEQADTVARRLVEWGVRLP